MGTITQFLDIVPMDFFLVSQMYTLATQEILTPELDRCQAEGVGVVVGAAFNSGILVTGAVEGAMYESRTGTVWSRSRYLSRWADYLDLTVASWRSSHRYNYEAADETVLAKVAAIHKVCTEHKVPL